ncbi:MAG: hypothetical protein ABL993_04960 [Vicinamibacterales bacterium]
MEPQVLLRQVLLLFGVGFLGANAKVVFDLVRYRARRRSALLTWEAAKPPYYGFSLALGVILGLLLAFRVFVQRRPPSQLFGETMMFVYYGYAMPLGTRIARGFYADGVWSDTGFMRWGQISAVSWKDAPVTLILVSHFRNVARRLVIPGPLYGQARRLLRDKVKEHAIHIGGTGLDLGSRDEADAV